jgi:hypothetical protein
VSKDEMPLLRIIKVGEAELADIRAKINDKVSFAISKMMEKQFPQPTCD